MDPATSRILCSTVLRSSKSSISCAKTVEAFRNVSSSWMESFPTEKLLCMRKWLSPLLVVFRSALLGYFCGRTGSSRNIPTPSWQLPPWSIHATTFWNTQTIKCVSLVTTNLGPRPHGFGLVICCTHQTTTSLSFSCTTPGSTWACRLSI
jgi:hypothetical protein